MKVFRTAWLTTNRNCNNNCNWCYAKKTLSSNAKMDFDQAKVAVDELRRRDVKKIVLIGGEPTIYPNFIELVDYIHKSGIKVSVASNGKLFSDMNLAMKVKEAGISHVDISIKATTEEEYFNNTHTNGLESVVKGYHNLQVAGVNVSASYVITDDNKESFDKLIDFLKTNKISSIFLQFIKPTLGIGEHDEIMRMDDMGKFVTYIYNRMKCEEINYSIEISFPICLVEENVWNSLVEEKRVANCCHVPKGTGINFDEKFRVIPCNHFGEFPFSSDPIDFSDPCAIDKLYSTKRVKKFRALTRMYLTEKCRTCDKWNICGGGCFTRWLSENPNNYIK